MCHDINPLGTVMHLRELDRRAERSCRGLQQAPEIRRHRDGSINFDLYRQLAAGERRVSYRVMGRSLGAIAVAGSERLVILWQEHRTLRVAASATAAAVMIAAVGLPGLPG